MKKIYTKKFRRNRDNLFAVRTDSINDAKLGAGYRLRWTEEGLMGEREAEASGEKIGRNISYKKISWLIIFLVAGFFLLFVKTAYLQIAGNSYYSELSEYNRIRKEPIMADRGVIYDKDGNVLTENKPIFYLQIIPADILSNQVSEEKRQEIIKIIGDIFGAGAEEDIDYLLIKHKYKTLESYQPQSLIDDINYQDAIKLMLAAQDMPGLSVKTKYKRKYNLPSLSLSHVLGYMGVITKEEYEKNEEYLMTDYTGKVGLEKFWEDELRGEYGEKYIEVDALGKEKRIISEVKKQDGYSLKLAIDSALQKKLEEEMVFQLKDVGASRASAIALNPNSGEIMAIVSLPSYDSNDFAEKISTEKYKELIEDENQPLYNRAIKGEFPTGSTFKMVVASAALQEGVINQNTKFNSTGGVGIKEWFFPDWKAGGHGTTDVRKAIAWSVNTFFYNISGGVPDIPGLGVEKITDYARLFGFGQTLGIDLPGEATGFLPSQAWKKEAKNEIWYPGDTLHLAIGQGDITATPLQIAAYTAFFANSGKLYQPHLVTELLNSDDSLYKKIEPKLLRHDFIEPEYVNIVREGLRQCVTDGSCASLQMLLVESAGKTGTAQWSSEGETHSWFTGFAPYENPQIVITVIVEEGGESTDAAVPIARRVMQWYFTK
ncbi:MAG: penicillin-binding protein 2 [Patescibacteria group bacterium]|jgi:penicillin-binding protein 2